MTALEQLYQQVILDHARRRSGYAVKPEAELEPRTGTYSGISRQYNPLCGDEVTLRATVSRGQAGEAVVREVSWDGEGCSISQAATSMLHELVVGRTAAAADEIVGQFRAMVRSRGSVPPDEEVLGDASAFAAVGRHPNRVKCAMLGWTAFEDALHQAIHDQSAVQDSTEDSP